MEVKGVQCLQTVLSRPQHALQQVPVLASRSRQLFERLKRTWNKRSWSWEPRPLEMLPLKNEPSSAEVSNRTCAICCESKALDGFAPVSLGCKHGADACTQCVQTHISQKIWDGKAPVRSLLQQQPERPSLLQGALPCIFAPTCGSLLTEQDLQQVAGPSLLEVWRRKLVQQDPRYQYCSRPGCDAGQLVADCASSPVMTCTVCGTKVSGAH